MRKLAKWVGSKLVELGEAIKGELRDGAGVANEQAAYVVPVQLTAEAARMVEDGLAPEVLSEVEPESPPLQGSLRERVLMERAKYRMGE